MIGRKRVLRVVAVLAVALATGHLVETLRSGPAIRDLAPGTALLAVHGGQGKSAQGSQLPESALLSAGGTGDLPPLTGITAVAAIQEVRNSGSCAPVLSLARAGGAMIDLALDAPCAPGQRVVIRHAGLSFTARTSSEGRLTLRLPALEADALVATYFEGSEVALARIEIPELAGLARFAFQAPFPVSFDLRADEGGLVYTSKGEMSAPDGGGKIMTLGTAAVSQPIFAQVYTFPAERLSGAELTVELRVTSETCGSTFQAETVLSQSGTVTRSTLPLAMPLCGTSGDILVLKNLVQDPTLAASN